METRTAIESHNLSFSYGTLPVLENVSFSVPEGSYTALIGANGAGKSTLLKLLLGELTPTSGSLSCSASRSARSATGRASAMCRRARRPVTPTSLPRSVRS